MLVIFSIIGILGLLMVVGSKMPLSVVQADPPTATPTYAPTITPEIFTPTPGSSPTPEPTVDLPTVHPIETDIPIP